MSDLDDVRDLLARYCLALDRHDVEAWVALFTTDATYHVYGRTFEGHDGLRSMMTNAPRGLHLGGQPVVELHDDGRASVQQNLLFLEVATGALRGAVYDDVLVRQDGVATSRWLFSTRRCRFITPDGLQDRPPRP